MAIKQGEAVFQAVSAEFDTDAAVPETGKWSDGQKERVHATVLQMFLDGTTSHAKNPSEVELKKYIPGLVNNWVRKDPRLNGGTKYVAKRPGSRAGTGDEQVRAMRQLLAATTDTDSKVLIQAELDKRIAALKPTVSIDASALPESLRHLVK